MTPDSENSVKKSIIVNQAAERTFQLWTEQIRAWWPAGHSLSGDPQTQVFIEGRVGGRFYERASDGVEYVWGIVEVWEPPERLAFTWYLGSSQSLSSRVEVHFIPLEDNQTRIELEHRGPELIGELWWSRKSIFNGAWERVLGEFGTFLAA
jgi:uncharacterized protein YndB with AHSA1/START domain